MSYQPDKLHIASNSNALYQQAADFIVQLAQACVEANGRFTIALAGGSTPKKLYALLATPAYREQIPWQQCHFYFGDERMVPHNHADSNYNMAKQALFSKVNLPVDNIHPIPTDCAQAADCAERYDRELQDLQFFDLVLLGMGDDGHTASLFPDTDILQVNNTMAAAIYVEKMHSWRISLTYPILNRAQQVVLLACGRGKAEMLSTITSGDDVFTTYPIKGIRPVGELHWFVDRDAWPDS